MKDAIRTVNHISLNGKEEVRVNVCVFNNKTEPCPSSLREGTVCRRGDQTAFHFDNLPNRTVALMEESRMTMTTKNDYTNLHGGGLV